MSTPSVVIKKGTGEAIQEYGVKTNWDYMVENDMAFVGSKVFSIAAGGSVEILFANPSGSGKTLKVRLLATQGTADGQVIIAVGSYGTTGTEDIVKSADGTDIPILNKKVGGTNASIAEFQYGGTYTVNTTDKTEALIPGGTGVHATGGSSTIGLAGEILEGYGLLVKINNISGADAYYSIRIEWWEE